MISQYTTDKNAAVEAFRCTETPQYYEPVVLLYELRGKELVSATCSQPRECNGKTCTGKKYSQHMFIVT